MGTASPALKPASGAEVLVILEVSAMATPSIFLLEKSVFKRVNNL